MTYVSRLEASQHDANVVYATFDNHKVGDFKPYVLRSADRGKTWTSIAGDLPARGSAYALVEDPKDPKLLYAGTELLHLHYTLSLLLSLLVVNLVGLLLNRRWTFESTRNPFWAEAMRYWSANALSALAVLASTALLVEVLHVHYLLANVLIAVLFMIGNFVLHLRWTFRARARSSSAERGSLQLTDESARLHLTQDSGEYRQGWSTFQRSQFDRAAIDLSADYGGEGYANEGYEFVECCANGGTPLVSWREGLQVQEIIDAIYRSVEAGHVSL